MQTICNAKNNTVKRRVAVILLLISLSVAVITIIATSAYFTDRHNVANKLSIGDDTIVIDEEFPPPEEVSGGDVLKKTVAVTNTGKVPCYVRVMVKFSNKDWGDLCSLDFNQTDWVQKDDGYWYYLKVVNPKEKTSNLFTKVTVANVTLPQSTFDIVVYGESVQSENSKDIYEAFASIR